jgi:3-hydroxyacyl-CoA dehydrogenase / enoyl-CoA hydratase / 3-hydroxybutyryl-CoA epimerase
MDDQNYKHWRLVTDEQGIVNLSFDTFESNTNVLSVEVLNELEAIIAKLKSQNPKALVISSAKTNGFIAGADVHSFSSITLKEQALPYIQLGQKVFNDLEALSFPTLAVIKGFCLGGGLELALACDYRVAVDDPRTRIGVPEVKLGFHPGWGGTVRLTQTVGPLTSMDLMLSGRTVNARAAKRMGVVDRAVPERHITNATNALLMKMPPRHKPSLLIKIINMRLFRLLLAKILKKKVGQRVRSDHYPAPYALIDLWVKHGSNKKKMMLAEAESVSDLITTSTAKNLVRVFNLQDQLKSFGQQCEFNPKHVHVVGAGIMGGDIAAWCAYRGLTVTLQDRELKYIAPAIKRAHVLFKKRLKKPYLIQAAMDRLTPDHKGLGITKADIVIEAIIENVDAKRELFKDMEAKIKQNTLLATNTSSISLELISSHLDKPGRLVGMHFFNPVAMMQLVEIVSGDDTDKDVSDCAAAFCRQIDRLPVPVKSSPGFLVNRILMPYLLEAITIVEEGVPARVVDEVALAYGMPMGPVELADTVGLDICLSVAGILAKSFDVSIPDNLRHKVEHGHMGRKTGQGYYYYKNKKPVYKKVDLNGYDVSGITDRLTLQILNESIACLSEGVVDDADLIDAAMIFGAGFAPFRGGPLHVIEETGRDNMLEKMKSLHQSQGERFAPHSAW